jgi:RNA-binding protein Musashi
MDSVKSPQGDSTESSHDSCKLFIGGLSGKTTTDMLRQYFSKFGTVSECTVMKDPVTRRSRGFGFVTFSSSASVENVLACENHEIDSNRLKQSWQFLSSPVH